MEQRLFEAIALYGNKYREKHLSSFDPQELRTNFWSALNFFLSRACFQGRRDQVSEKVYNAVIEILAPEFSTSNRVSNYRALSRQSWKPIKRSLGGKIGKGHVGKARDIEMVLSVLDFTGRSSDLNIVKYSVRRISQGNIDKHYVELQRSLSDNGIIQVGPKIAALYLRDVVSLYRLDNKISAESSYCLQPVDTWVRKLARHLEIVGREASDQEIQRAIVDLCQKNGVSPILFNQGAWYLSYNSFEIVLNLLGNGK